MNHAILNWRICKRCKKPFDISTDKDICPDCRYGKKKGIKAMEEIRILIDDSCDDCKKGLVYLKKLHKRNRKAYGCFILHPMSRFIKEKRDLGEQDIIKGLTLRPDYNSSGYLTHFHIEKEKREYGKRKNQA